MTSPKPTHPWAAAVQNLAALAAIVALSLTDKISGEVASGMILAVTGVIALPALRKNGGDIGTVGVLALASPLGRALAAVFGARFGA